MDCFRLFVVAALLVFPAGAARAGDVAQLGDLGFSADGGIFAFEEFGVQDGSGFPYAHRFYIDTARDRFLPGTPIRVRPDDESIGVDQVRVEARAQGEAILAAAIMQANRGISAGFNAVTEYSADPLRMEVNPRPVFPPIDAPLEFRLEILAHPQPDRCNDETVGFRLLRIRAADGGVTELVHEDRHLPASRGCPTGYRIGAIQTFFPEAGDAVYAVMIAVQELGFEGPDYRWMAVTGRF